MASELEERARGLAVLLSPLRIRQGSTDEAAGIGADLKWPATHVLCDLLSASSKEGALSRDDADSLLRAVGYDLAMFETRSWLRWVLGRFELPMGVGIAVAGVEADRPPPRVPEEELRAIAPLRSRIHAYVDGRPILSKDAAQSILRIHSSAPTLEELASEGAIIINGSNVSLETGSTLWNSRGDLIAATLWARDPRRDLLLWLAHIRSAWCIRAPKHLPPEQRGILLDAMVSAIEQEPDLKDWAAEISHIAPDVGYLGHEVRSVAPPRPTQLARHRWWRHLRVEGGRCRDRLACLVASVVRNDSSLGARPFSRIRKLLSLASNKAWLAQVLPQKLLHLRPEALASLAVDPENAVLAMSLLDSLSIVVYSWDSAHERVQRAERYRTAIWREALSLFVSGLVDRGEVVEDASRNCIELLSYMQSRSTQGSLVMDPAQREIHDSEVRERLNAFALELSRAKLPSRPHGNVARFLPNALPVLAMSLAESLQEERNKPRRLSLLFWVFERAVEEGQKALAASYANTISDELIRWLNHDLEDGTVDAWFDEELPIADFPWQKVFFASLDATNRVLDEIELYRKDVGTILRGVRQKSDVKEDSNINSLDGYQLQSTLIRKRRLYLALLIQALERVSSASRVVSQPPAVLELRLQQRVVRLLGDEATSETNVFSGAPYVPANSELLAAALHAVERLPTELLQKSLSDWILKDDDPFLVLSILSETRSNRFRAVAEGRFVLIDWEAYLAKQTFWPTMFTLARLAIAAGKLEVAETILRIDSTPSAREEQSFVPRIMLATARGDDIDAVTPPQDSSSSEKDVVAFFQGLRELSTQPADAVITYEALVHRRAYIAGSAVNLFSARLRVASDMKDVDERAAAIASALGEWKEIAPVIPAQELRRVAWAAHQNELYALHQLGLHADFWRLWHDLPIDQAASEPFVRISLVAATARADYRVRVLELATAFHGEPTPEWLRTLQLETDQGKRQGLVPPRTAQLSDDEIRAAYSEGLRRPITSRALIFSSVADADLDDFLLDLHLNAARELQRLEIAVGQLTEEDKLSDLMIAFLRSACRAIGITIHSQERGGLSGGDSRTTERGGVGERDWTVQADAVEVAVVEALQLPSAPSVIQHHLKKLLERYDRAGLPRAFMLLYVRDIDFDAQVEAYQSAVQAWASVEAPLIGSVKVHATPAAYLKILRTTHRRGQNAETFVFHLLVRIPRQSRQSV